MGGSTVRCEEVRELLPEHVDGELHVAGEVEAHLASCAACSAELAAYRGMLADLAGLRDLGEEPHPELLHRMLALIPAPRLADRLIGSFRARRVLVVVASLGGAVVAAAVALRWLRRRRALAASAP